MYNPPSTPINEQKKSISIWMWKQNPNTIFQDKAFNDNISLNG
jgi:hypothetical protein